jgi:hypothetical protein
LIDRVVEPEAIRYLLVGRIAQDRVGATDEDRDVGRADVKLIEDRLRLGVAIEVDVVERMAVAGQEFLHAQRAGAMCRSQHDHVAELVGDQLEAAQHERPHENLAQLGVGLNQGEQLLARQLDDFAWRGYAQPGDRRPAGDHDGFAGELSRAVRHDQRVGGAGGPQGLHCAAEHQEEGDLLVPHLNEDLVASDRTAPPTGHDTGDLGARSASETAAHVSWME